MATDGTQMPRIMKWVFVLLLAAGWATVANAATPIPDGRWRFKFVDAKGQADKPFDVYTYRPRRCDSKCPIVFVLHGLSRNASTYRDYWELVADKHQLLVVAPLFSQKDWPGDVYNLGDVAAQADREKWGYSAIEHLFDEVRDGQSGYAIFGHSAGGQFVQRMAIFRPDNRATVMAVGNPGWYLMPEWRKEKASDPYPYSRVTARVGESELRQALAKRFIVLAGENDNDPDAKNLNKSAGALREGATRLERAENFFKAATAAAAETGVKFTWELVEVPKTAHDGAAMSRAAADAMFGKK